MEAYDLGPINLNYVSRWFKHLIHRPVASLRNLRKLERLLALGGMQFEHIWIDLSKNLSYRHEGVDTTKGT